MKTTKKDDFEIKIYDENKNEFIFKILFTYENENRNSKYVFLYKEEVPDEIIVMKYNDNNEIFEIYDEEELKEAQEVLDAYESDPKINEIK